MSLWKHFGCFCEVKYLMFNEIGYGVTLSTLWQDKVMRGKKPMFMCCSGTFYSIVGRKQAKYVIYL